MSQPKTDEYKRRMNLTKTKLQGTGVSSSSKLSVTSFLSVCSDMKSKHNSNRAQSDNPNLSEKTKGAPQILNQQLTTTLSDTEPKYSSASVSAHSCLFNPCPDGDSLLIGGMDADPGGTRTLQLM